MAYDTTEAVAKFLSGFQEARDAATSRNGLNENRKSVAEMIQECFDSIENNGDAI